jgi:MFS family permease
VVAASGLVLGAGLLGLVAANAIPLPGLVPMFVIIGLFIGATGPSRDMIVRHATPKGAAGRVYGFVYSGLDLGLALAPLLFGGFMDTGRFSSVLIGIAILQALAIFTALRVGRTA